MKFDDRREIQPANDRACKDCPWRASNRGRANEHGFYTAKNLRRLWVGMRNGERMTCHPTDPRMAEYSGYEKTDDAPVVRECAGSLLLKAREISLLNDLGRALPKGADLMRAYRAASPLGLTRKGIKKIIKDQFEGAIGQTLSVRPTITGDPDVAYVKVDEAKERAARAAS